MVVSDTVVAPVSALATLVAPVPELPANTTTFNDCSHPPIAGVDVTVMFESADGATAVQISAVPNCALARVASCQVKPPPVTVTVCFDEQARRAAGRDERDQQVTGRRDAERRRRPRARAVREGLALHAERLRG